MTIVFEVKVEDHYFNQEHEWRAYTETLSGKGATVPNAIMDLMSQLKGMYSEFKIELLIKNSKC